MWALEKFPVTTLLYTSTKRISHSALNSHYCTAKMYSDSQVVVEHHL